MKKSIKLTRALLTARLALVPALAIPAAVGFGIGTIGAATC